MRIYEVRALSYEIGLDLGADRRQDRYLEQLKHAKIKGYLFQQQNFLEGGTKDREG